MRGTAEITMAGALNTALADAMSDDPKVLVFGEDVGALGGVFRITDGLQKDFGEDRVIDSPLAESGIVGTAVGMAMYGMKPVVEMQFDAFAYPAFEQITSHVAKLRNRTRGALSLPMVIRVLMHYYAPDAHRSQHVYLGDARGLRADLDAAQ